MPCQPPRQRKSRRSSAAPSYTLIESFEPRLFMAIDVAVGVDQPVRVITFTDGDGTEAMIRVAGGAATATFDGPVVSQTTQGTTSTVSGTDVQLTNLVITSGANPKVTIMVMDPGADGLVGLGGLSAAGPVGAINARGTVLRGATTLSNGIGRLDLAGVQNANIVITRGSLARLVDAAMSLGDVQDVTIDSHQPLRQLRVASWTEGAGDVDNLVITPRINTIQSAGDFNADLALSGAGQVVGRPILGNVRVSGALASGTWNVTGRVSRVSAASVGGDWEGNFGDLSRFSVAGDMAGHLTAEAMNSVSANTITGADIRSTRAMAPRVVGINRLSARGAITGSDIRSDADIGSVSALSISDSIIYAGIDLTPGGGGPGPGGNRALPSDVAHFVTPATIRNVTIRTRTGAPGYVDTNIAAATLGRMNLGAVQVANNGDPFGLAALELRSLSAVAPDGTPIRGTHFMEPTQSVDMTDFKVRIF